MKKSIVYIFFLLTVVLGCYTIVENYASEKVHLEIAETDEASQQTDQVLSVLIEANSYADVSGQTSVSCSFNFVRRYRPSGFLLDKLYDYMAGDQKNGLLNTIKTTSEFVEAYAAHQKNDGYYIYSLRRIII